MTDSDCAGKAGTADAETPLLSVDGLETHYPVTSGLLRREVGRVRAVDGVSFELDRGEALGVVGESGSGKTTLAHSLLRLEEPSTGDVLFHGEPVTELSGADLRAFRRQVQLIVQDPSDAFNPRMRVGEAVAEPLVLHGMTDADRRRAIVEDLLERVDLSADDADRYPHEFSSGERQRIAIARALVVDPDVVVADEPTSALDGRTRTDVLALLDHVRRAFDVAVLFISHDIDVVRRFCDRVAVMYLGEFVEQGATDEVLGAPAHPYTRLLLDSLPDLDPTQQAVARPLTETVPDPADPPPGCRFHPRCRELIPPSDVDLPRDLFLAVAAFRFTLQAGKLPAELGGEAGDESVTDESVRAAFDLPETIPDEPVDHGVDEAIAALARGDSKAARAHMEATLPTVCERTEPEPVTACGRSVRCHRYDPDSEGEPHAW